ncbi:MAG TPA: hypothetical protein VF958_02220 [Thermoanaerobaculia bacterium]
MRFARGGMLVACLVLSQGVVFAQYEVGIPVPNWTVPPFHGAGAERGLSPMSDISLGVAFVAMLPCRVFDTRGPNGPYGGPRLLANTTRNFDIDSGPCTGIPTGVDAYSMNFGAILPDGANSFITIWPTGFGMPTVSSINPIQGAVVANAAIVPAGDAGSISVFPNTGVHLYGDINGYFTDQFNSGIFLHAVSSNVAPAIIGDNNSMLGSAFGVLGHINTTTTGSASAGVRGMNDGLGLAGVGVWGSHAAGGWGTFGEAVSGVGVYGKATATTGANYGMRAETASTFQNSAGIRASNGPAPPSWTILSAGVRGEAPSLGFGVVGMSRGWAGVSGYFLDTAGNISAGADLGYTPTVGLNVTGSTQATGVKNFIEPHPTDPSKVIRYISLEGNEAGTYFRGRGKFQNGIAMIDVPEDFRIVTDSEGLGIQVTPIGQMATVAVEAIGLDRIVVRGSRDVEFFYTVNGIRSAYKDAGPIVENDKAFVPRSPDATMPEAYPAGIRQRLISNGIYRPDGTVNMETARRLGWDKEWERRERPAPQPASD